MAVRIDASTLFNFNRGVERVVEAAEPLFAFPRASGDVLGALPARRRNKQRYPATQEERLLDLLRPELPPQLMDWHSTDRCLIALARSFREAVATAGEQAQLFRRAAMLTHEEIQAREMVKAYKRSLYSV
ncbi:hypothetical protein PIN31115_04495 [Pandoraea iniqua]|uniref:Uncharacterized protein n=1 Tax=Pandoraea iniqua TaxID=2508288 RepID=A0A5E4YGK2_9BURK|nr:hypothetical protein [Pandoraea iniqua]VVE47956.1 hypothetical protein PIN31115_04495 [Pandoraea iniqua]